MTQEERRLHRLEQNRQWRVRNCGKLKATRERNREKRLAAHREWWRKLQADPVRRAENIRRSTEYHRRKLAEDPVYRAKNRATKQRHYRKKVSSPEGREHVCKNALKSYHRMKADEDRCRAHLERDRKWRSDRKRRDPDFAIRTSLRSRLSDLVRRGRAVKCQSALRLTGCSVEELRRHLEAQFANGMSWGNYGRVWHIDHIIPCSHFDLTSPQQQAICFNYLNLRPCFASENLRKGNRLEGPLQMPLGI